MADWLTNDQAEQVTALAYDILTADLERTANVLSEQHKEALRHLVAEMTGYASGWTTGRRAFSLGTGCGKTSAIIAWITALHRLGIRSVAVSVSASKVEALCDLKSDLMRHGVPEHLIGLKHSYRDATLPSTGDDDRIYQLVTHARVRGGSDNPLFIEHKGQQRALMIYDESLIRSDVEVISERTLRKQVAALKEDVRGRPLEEQFHGLFCFLEGAIQSISDGLTRHKEHPRSSQLLTIEAPDGIDLDAYRTLLGSSVQWETIRRFLNVVGSPLRLLRTKQDEGLVWYQISVPPELANILILDASYPIRELVRLDSSITDSTPDSVREVKRFDRVTVYQMNHPSGRGATTENFGKRWTTDRTMSKEIVKVVQSIPEDKAILFFTFKPRPQEANIRDILLRDLSDAGIDVHASTPEGKPRISVLTWGDETSLNRYAHCEVVILVGLLHLPHLDIASLIVGQQDSLKATTSNKQIEQVNDSEIAHSVYQAISRGACRVVEDGQAKAMDVYLFHPKASLQETLQFIMPGLVWKPWMPSFIGEDTKLSQSDIQAMQIKAYLEAQPEDRTKIPTREIRAALSIDTGIDKCRKAFDRAIEKLCYSGFWVRHGHSLVRMGTMFG